MTNLFKCLTCSQVITAEELDLHKCKARLTKYRTIEATSYFTVKNDSDEDCIVIDALNGIGYTFVVKQPNLIPISDLDSNNRQLTGRNTNREDNSTLLAVLFR